MPGHNQQFSSCKLCGGSVDLETGVELTIERGAERTQVALCADCASVECTRCDNHVSIRSVLEGHGRSGSGHEFVECSRCGEEVRAADAAEIRHTQIKQYRKRVCGECLDQIAVTADYRVLREFSPT